MSCKIRRKKKNIVLDEKVVAQTYKKNINYDSLIKDLYGPEILKLCHNFTNEFYNSSTMRFAQETIISGTKIGSKIIPDNRAINYPGVGEFIACSIFEKLEIKIIPYTKGPDIVVTGVAPNKDIIFDVKIIHNNKINSNHGSVNTLKKNIKELLSGINPKNLNDLIGRFNNIKPNKGAKIDPDNRNRVTDLIIYIEIEDNTITDCIIVPLLCTIKIKNGVISNKGGSGDNVMTALRAPKEYTNLKNLVSTLQADLIKHRNQKAKTQQSTSPTPGSQTTKP